MFAMKTKQKKQVTFDDLDLPKVGDDSRFVEACKRLEFYELELKRLKDKYFKTTGDFGAPKRSISNASEDAQKLLDGGTLDQLETESVVDYRASLLRKIKACEHALPILRQRRDTIWRDAILEGCSMVEGQAEAVVKDVVIALERLEIAIKRERDFFSALGRLGYKQSVRPGHWMLHPIEGIYLDGAQNGFTLPSLRYHIEQRRESWGFDDKE